MTEKAGAKNQDKTNTVIGALVVAALLIWLGISLFGGKSDKADTTVSSPEEATNQTTHSDFIANTNLTERAVEETCEDAKYGVANGYSVVAMSNYDFQVYDTGSYDENANPIVQALWNGKRDSDKAVVKYWCYVSGADDDNITVHYISVGDNASRKDIWKSQNDLDFNSYDKEGNPEYPDLH